MAGILFIVAGLDKGWTTGLRSPEAAGNFLFAPEIRFSLMLAQHLEDRGAFSRCNVARI
jgi:hypothetical protein